MYKRQPLNWTIFFPHGIVLKAKAPWPAIADFFTVRGYLAPLMVFFILFLERWHATATRVTAATAELSSQAERNNKAPE